MAVRQLISLRGSAVAAMRLEHSAAVCQQSFGPGDG